MKKTTLRIYAVAASAGLLIAAGSSASPQQTGLPDLGAVSYDQMVQVGQPFAFAVSAVAGGSYQWLRNGVALNGQTNSTLSLASTQISDAGYYSCNVATGLGLNLAIVPSITAYLEVYTYNFTPDGFLGLVVYGAPLTGNGNSGTCPGHYTGYVTYFKTAAQGWGWAPSTNTTTYTATDTTRTDTKVEYGGDYGDEGCAKTTVTIPSPTFSPVYRFAIYFTNNVPTTNYPITLIGFNP